MGRHKRFVDNFWVEDINSTSAFDTLSQRMREGRKLCKDIEEYLRQRSKIESTYVKELQKLNKPDHKEELGVLEHSWRELKQQTENIAHMHDIAAKQFQALSNEISSFNTEQKKITKEWEDRVSKLHSAAKSTYSKVNNQQKMYKNKYEESTNADSTLKYNEKHHNAITPKEMEKLRTKADKSREDLLKADDLYKSLVEQVQQEMWNWERDMTSLCNNFQDLEEKRIDHLRDYLWKCTNIDSQCNVDCDQCCERVRGVLEKCDIDDDIDVFITKCGTGNRHPARVEYRGYGKGSPKTKDRGRLPSLPPGQKAPTGGYHIYTDIN